MYLNTIKERLYSDDEVYNWMEIMTTRALLLASGFASLNLFIPAIVLAENYAGIADDLSNATVSVLSRLGYDCQTASAGAILCKKCTVNDNKQKCEAFVCDAVTKKCRKKSAEIPRLPFNSEQ